MALLVNSAGATAADPLLKGIPFQWVIGASSMDVATFTDAWIETTSTIPGTGGSVKASLHPTSTVLLSGTTATYATAGQTLTLTSTTGLSAGDFIYLSGGGATSGLYGIATVVNATQVTLVSAPAAGNLTGVSYQTAWSYDGIAGTTPDASSAAGQINYMKVSAQDSLGNVGTATDFHYVRDAPAGTSFISIDGKTYDGTASTNVATPSFNILPSWVNKGGISHIALANHSVSATNEFRWSDGTAGEKTLAAAVASGFTFNPTADALKRGRLLLRSKTGSIALGVDIAITLDTTGPSLIFAMFGR